MKRKTQLGTGAAVALMVVVVLAVQMTKRGPAPSAAAVEDYMARPSVSLAGTLRDFKPRMQSGGHPDFSRPADEGWGRYALVATPELDVDGKPVFNSTGHRMTDSWTDAEGGKVGPFLPYVETRAGDVDATIEPGEGGAVTTAANFAQWFRDDPAFNTSQRNTVTVVRQPDGTYFFEGRVDDPATGVQPDYDYTSTYEIDTTFVHKEGRGWYIDLGTDADVWMFIDGRLVVDGGSGVAAPFMFPGIALEGSLKMTGTSQIELASGTVASISTNATGNEVVRLRNSASIAGHLLVGPGGDPTTAVRTDREMAVSGDTGALDEPVVIDPIKAPTDMGPALGNLKLTGKTLVIDRDAHFADVTLDTSAKLRIRGDVRMLVDDDFHVLNSSAVELEPDSSLALYIGGEFEMRNLTRFNDNTKDSSLVTISVFGTETINIDNYVEIYANFRAPDAGMVLGNNSTITGSFHGEWLEMDNSGRFVVEDPLAGEREGANFVDLAMTQRIDLDRLGWLEEDRTHSLKIFFAERARPRSTLRIDTNVLTLNLASQPALVAHD